MLHQPRHRSVQPCLFVANWEEMYINENSKLINANTPLTYYEKPKSHQPVLLMCDKLTPSQSWMRYRPPSREVQVQGGSWSAHRADTSALRGRAVRCLRWHEVWACLFGDTFFVFAELATPSSSSAELALKGLQGPCQKCEA